MFSSNYYLIIIPLHTDMVSNTAISYYFKSYVFWREFNIPNVSDCGLEIRDIELQSVLDKHTWKGVNPLIPQLLDK